MNRRIVNWTCVVLTFLLFGASYRPEPAGYGRDVRNVILIVVDTFAAQNLGFMGYDRETSPFLDELASRSVVFDRGYTPMATTEPSITGILSGLHPRSHGILENGTILPEDLHFLTENFQREGFRTWGVPAFEVIGGRYGMNKGFDFYANAPAIPKQASRVIDRVRRMVEGDTQTGEPSLKDSTAPVFMFVHFYDTHTDYTPDADALATFADRHYGGPVDGTFKQLDQYNQRNFAFNKGDVRRVRDLYDAEILSLDSRLRELFGIFKNAGLMDDSVIVVTADHGENLGEHHYFTHNNPYETALHVPLMFHFPHDAWAGKRIGALVENTDIMPTLMELAGVHVPDGIDGKSLVNTIRGMDISSDERRIFLCAVGEKSSDGTRSVSVFDGTYRLTEGVGKSDERMLFDIISDPHESRDLSMGNQAMVEKLAHMVLNLDLQIPPSGQPDMDPQTREMLMSLGYVH